LKTQDKPPALNLKSLAGALIVLLLELKFYFILAFLCKQIISFPNPQSAIIKPAGENDTQEKNALNPSSNN
jgi:hypothetical protein